MVRSSNSSVTVNNTVVVILVMSVRASNTSSPKPKTLNPKAQDKGMVTKHGMVKITGRYKEIIIGAGGRGVFSIRY